MHSVGEVFATKDSRTHGARVTSDRALCKVPAVLSDVSLACCPKAIASTAVLLAVIMALLWALNSASTVARKPSVLSLTTHTACSHFVALAS